MDSTHTHRPGLLSLTISITTVVWGIPAKRPTLPGVPHAPQPQDPELASGIMHTLGCEPRTRAKIPAGTQDQQASGFLVEVMHVQHVPSFKKMGEAPEPSPQACLSPPALGFPSAASASHLNKGGTARALGSHRTCDSIRIHLWLLCRSRPGCRVRSWQPRRTRARWPARLTGGRCARPACHVPALLSAVWLKLQVCPTRPSRAIDQTGP